MEYNGKRKTKLNIKERKVLNGILAGTRDINSSISQKYLKRPHVIQHFNTILDDHGLSDAKLAQRVSQIVDRTAIERTDKHGNVVSSNITTIDANALQAIRTIWQAKGKFTEKKEVSITGNINNLPDDQLDKMIAQGMESISDKVLTTQVLNAVNDTSKPRR
jgi:uncharacterized protein YsxB (DUF464 family)